MTRRALLLAAAAAALVAAPGRAASSASHEAVLPPELPWEGRSVTLMLPPDDPWATPSERTGLRRTPGYDETVAWLQRLAGAAPEVSLVSLGKSPEGRDLWMVVASADGSRSPEEVRRKPLLLAQGGIHSGEIDGKDAGMMLLRDMTVRGTRRDLLERANLLFVPIFNVDGHERSSRHSRINQRGPEEAGWRTTSRNLNLNRDYAKLDAPEMQALIRALGEWQPDLYLDLHVTDGADYQYDLTWGYNRPGYSPAISSWLDRRFTPPATALLEEWGHVPGPLIFGVEGDRLEKGIVEWIAGPRFSTGYGDARHLPTVLLENHSLKPYRQRVLGTYLFLEAAMRALGEHAEELRGAVAQDRARRPAAVPLAWEASQDPPPILELKGVAARFEPSVISGGERTVWTGEPVTLQVPLIRYDRPAVEVSRPSAYWIPPAWTEVIERLRLHGIQMRESDTGWEGEVEVYRIEDPSLQPEPFEGHARVRGTAVRERRRMRFPPGSVRVRTDQPLGTLAMLLLEPDGSDSFFRWGFFLEPLQRTEYVEGYVMEPMAERMLAQDPDLAAEFEAKLASDPEFAADPRQRLQWFYRRTPFWDDTYSLYPVAREP